MNEIEPLKYTVVIGEVIDIVVTPTGTGSSSQPVSMVTHYRLCQARPQRLITGSWSIDRSCRTHFLAMEFSLPGAGKAQNDTAISVIHRRLRRFHD